MPRVWVTSKLFTKKRHPIFLPALIADRSDPFNSHRSRTELAFTSNDYPVLYHPGFSSSGLISGSAERKRTTDGTAVIR